MSEPEELDEELDEELLYRNRRNWNTFTGHDTGQPYQYSDNELVASLPFGTSAMMVRPRDTYLQAPVQNSSFFHPPPVIPPSYSYQPIPENTEVDGARFEGQDDLAMSPTTSQSSKRVRGPDVLKVEKQSRDKRSRQLKALEETVLKILPTVPESVLPRPKGKLTCPKLLQAAADLLNLLAEGQQSATFRSQEGTSVSSPNQAGWDDTFRSFHAGGSSS